MHVDEGACRPVWFRVLPLSWQYLDVTDTLAQQMLGKVQEGRPQSAVLFRPSDIAVCQNKKGEAKPGANGFYQAPVFPGMPAV